MRSISRILFLGPQVHFSMESHSYCDTRYKNMLIGDRLGLFFLECTCPVGIFFFFFSYLDEEGSNNTYLLNLIFELFVPFHFVCLVLLKCACYHYRFNLLWSRQSTIIRLVSPWNLVPTGRFFVHPRGWDYGATIYWRGRSWQFEPLLFLSALSFFTQKLYFWSFL